MSIQTVLTGLLKKVISFLKSDKGKADVVRAAQLIEVALPYVIQFASAGYVPANVVALLEHYALPIADSLVKGTAPLDEIKLLVGAAVSTLLVRNLGVSTTVANMARDMAFTDAIGQKLIAVPKS